MTGKYYLFVVVGCLALASLVSSEPKATNAAVSNTTEDTQKSQNKETRAYDLPPPPAPIPAPEPVPPPAVPPPPVVAPTGFFGLPGFSKNLNLGAFAGPWLAGLGGGLGGLGGGFGGPGPAIPPPVGGDGPVPGGPGLGGPGPGIFGTFMGPSYIPATWLGSALGAKYDILFPLVIFVFFVAGVWTVINFLLALLIPLFMKKAGAIGALGAMKKIRSVDEKNNCQKEQMELAQKVLQAIQKQH